MRSDQPSAAAAAAVLKKVKTRRILKERCHQSGQRLDAYIL